MPNKIINRRIVTISTGYKWLNSLALIYWNALTTANSGLEVNGSVYAISTNKLKSLIDAFFVTGNADGWLSDMIVMPLFIGGTSTTHAVNAKTPGTFNISFVASPTHSANGSAFNGTTQYIMFNNVPSTDGLTAASNGLTVKTNSFTSGLGFMGSQNGTASAVFALTRLASVWNFYSLNGTLGLNTSAVGTNNVPITGSRISATDSQIYVNGSSVSTLATTGGSLPGNGTYVMAINANGTAGSFVNGRIVFASEHLGLTSAKVTSLHTAINTLQTGLGR